MLRTGLHLFLQSCGCLQLRHLKFYPCLSSYYPLSHRLHTGFKKTHYEVLELSRTATPAEIKAAFVRLSKRYHPDKNPSDPKMHDKFVILNAAYSVLSKSSSKQEYDITLGYQRRTVHHTQNASPFYTHQPKNTAHSKPHSWNSYQAEYDQQPHSQRRQWHEGQMRPDNSMGLKISAAALGLGFIYLYLCIRFSMRQRRLSRERDMHLMREMREEGNIFNDLNSWERDEHGMVRRKKKTTESEFELEEETSYIPSVNRKRRH